PKRRKQVSAEAVAFGGSTAATVWTGVSEYLPPIPKAIVGTVLSAVASWSAFKAWRDKINTQRRRGSDEDR
ncbi:hypothetical protein, partial [Micromonospora endophytica]|uniref:hypothetical protein n=1 Tax=Micromonospora endophytica TaxID=515350 RepID=UPI001CB9C071